MRFLTDQDVYALTVQLLRDLDHDVVTRDRDFGNLVIVQGLTTGVVYLRLLPSTLAAVHAELERVLARYNQTALLRAFVVVEPARHRLRRLPEPDSGDESA